MSNLERDTVKRVRKALLELELPDTIRELPSTARTAADAAEALGVEVGAVVKTKVFTIGPRYVLTFVSAENECQPDQLPKVFGLDGDVVSPAQDLIRAVTGFEFGAVAPLGLMAPLPIAIDGTLKKHDKLYVAAGHTHVVFETTADELKTITDGMVSYAVAKAPTKTETSAPQKPEVKLEANREAEPELKPKSKEIGQASASIPKRVKQT
ncbi:YbaK/EbsC family protein [Magnetovibrio sp. PR-2]|uniref:YbaK/EbsC family protein n=1 Tax=Magnetovibrio sp. PR-2 TaxID=3120356 RepID=UPI002FCDF0A0